MIESRSAASLTGKVVLITGGTSGLGRWTTRIVAERGAMVVFTGRNRAGADDTADMLASEGLEAEFLQHDVTDESDWQRVIADVASRHGRLDGLVNNAGVSRLKPMADLATDDFEFLLRVNVDGMYLGTQYAMRAMRKSGGSIVNISALNALRGSPNSTGYCLAKAGTTQLARIAAVEGRPFGIRANAVHPGVLFENPEEPSPGAIALFGEEGARQFVRYHIETTPLGRLGHPRDIGSAVAFLLSDAARHVSGTAFVVDGGRMAGEFIHHGVRSAR